MGFSHLVSRDVEEFHWCKGVVGVFILMSSHVFDVDCDWEELD